MLNRVLFKGNSYSGSAVIIVTATDVEGAVGTESVVLSMTGSNTPPTITHSVTSMTISEDSFLSFDSNDIAIIVDDVDVGDTPGGYLEVAISSSDSSTLEVQSVTTSIDHYYPVWVVETAASGGTLSGTFRLTIDVSNHGGNGASVTCETNDIYDNALDKKLFEDSSSSVSGFNTGESVESLLNALSCLRDLDIYVEVSKDGADAGQVDSDGNDASNPLVNPMNNNDNESGGGSGSAQNGHSWRVTFVNARDDFPGLTVTAST